MAGCVQARPDVLPAPSGHVEQGQAFAATCDLTGQPAELLVNEASVAHTGMGLMMRLDSHRQMMLPANPAQWIPGEGLNILVYAAGQSISYQKIEDDAFSREQQAGVSMPELYRKVYGLAPLQAGDEEHYHISGIRQMLDITCAEPNFRQYILAGGDTAIIQYLDGRYWVLVFSHQDNRIVYNLEFRRFSEEDVVGILKTWSIGKTEESSRLETNTQVQP